MKILCGSYEIAFENGWLSAAEIREGVKDLLKTEYGQYLMRITEGK